MKKIIILLCILTILLTGCNKKTVHSYKALERHINKIEMHSNIEYKDYNLNLKGKYKIIDKKEYIDEDGKKARYITVKMNDTDFVFTVSSYYGCTGMFDTCQSYGYKISDDYIEASSEYFTTTFAKEYGYEEAYCVDFDGCYIDTKKELDNVIVYMVSFLDYINDFDFLPIDILFYRLNFGNNYNISLSVDIKNNKYCYVDYDEEDNPIILRIYDEIKEFIEEKLNKENIVLQ